jgi:flagellar operon protein
MSYRVINGKLYSIDDYSKLSSDNKKNQQIKTPFEDLLSKEAAKKDSFLISNHAAERLRERNIFLNERDMHRINEGLNKAMEKGSNESVLLYKDLVLVASIKNRTIITAVDRGSSKDNVFTNIDSVVLL